MPTQREQFEGNMLQFLRNEIETGITFARLAQDKHTEEAQQRSLQNARKAYDTAEHFLKEHPVGGPSAQRNLLTQMSALKDLLIQLGETFEE